MRKFWNPLGKVTPLISPIFLPWWTLSKPPSGSFIECLYLKFLKMLEVTSPLSYSLMLQKKNQRYWLLFCSFGVIASPYSMRVRGCMGHLQATLEFGVFTFIHSSSLGLGLFLSQLLYMEDSTKLLLSKVRLDLLLFGVHITTKCDDSDASDT